MFHACFRELPWVFVDTEQRLLCLSAGLSSGREADGEGGNL